MKNKFLPILLTSFILFIGSCGPSDPTTKEQITTTKVPPGERATYNIKGGIYPDTAAAKEEVLLNHDPGGNRIGKDKLQSYPEEKLTNDVDSLTEVLN